MSEAKKTIILDCDGVLLQWESNLPFFALENGLNVENILKAFTATEHLTFNELFGVPNKLIGAELLQRYNEGKFGRYLAPYNDAVVGIKKLSERYNLICLSSFGSTTEAWINRKKNLQAFFPDCFKEVITIPINESKVKYVNHIMKTVNVVAFVDDQIKNIKEIETKCGVLSLHLNRNIKSRPITQSLIGKLPCVLNNISEIHDVIDFVTSEWKK